jgi:PAS domain S-box-containing protein
MVSPELSDSFGLVLDGAVVARQPQALVHLLDLLGLSYDAIFLHDLNSTITYWDKGAESLYGWSANEALGERSHSLLRTQFPPLPLPLDDLLVRDGNWEGELIHRRKDGTLAVVLSRQVLLRDRNDRPITVLETNRHVVGHTADALARQALGAIVESSEDAILSKNLDAIILSWNAGAERLYGYSAAEVIGQSVSIIIPPEMPDELPAIMDRLKRGQGIEHYQTERITKDGRRLTISLTVSPIRNDSGVIVGASAVARDITEQQRIVNALRLSEERLQLAARAAGFGTYDDRGSGEVYWSPEMLEIFGLPADTQPVHGAAAALEHIHPEDRERWLEARAAAHDPAGEGIMSIDHRVIRPDGTTIWVAQRGKVFRGDDSAGRRGRAIGIVQDVTGEVEMTAELARTAEALDKALAETRDALRVRDEFFSSISHDLRNPLAVIRGMVQLAQRQLNRLPTGETAGIPHLLTDIDKASRKMGSMIDELLDLSRVESGHSVELNLERADLVSLVQRLVDESEREAPEHILTMQASVPDIYGLWDSTRLDRVITNLLSNAIKYTPAGGHVGVLVETEAVDDGSEWAIVSVQDDGIGIPAEELTLIFDRYHRASNVPHHTPGAGIGLAGARQIVQHHGGTLRAESAEGAGSRFVMRLPVNPVRATYQGDTSVPAAPPD